MLEFYKRSDGHCPTQEFLDNLQQADLDKVISWLELLEERGHLLHRPFTDTAQGKIKYLRVRKGTMVYRIFYFFDRDKIITVNGYIKKEGRLDQAQIDQAERLRIEYLNRKT